MGAADDILEWSATKLTPWRQDALRRLACSPHLANEDELEILALIKERVGFAITPKPAPPQLLTKAHLAIAAGGTSIHIKGIRDVKNVNRLVPSAALNFGSVGLTLAYGKNGSGKSGFVRIFRTACRTRTENANKLKVLADVYGSGSGPQQAEIVVDVAGAEVIVPWKAGALPSDTLLAVAVFDSAAAQLYVDGGNQIQFLPFGLALPHKLNELCSTLKLKLEVERKPTTDQLALVTVNFEALRPTKAQLFYGALNSKSTDAQIDLASAFSEADEKRLAEIATILAATAASAADMTAIATWVQHLADESVLLDAAYGDTQMSAYRSLRQSAVAARDAAGLRAIDLFANDPLPGVGGETWRRLWLAAREYSVAEAYPDKDFPVLASPGGEETCVLCQQPLGAEGSDRLKRFQDYVSGNLAEAAAIAEAAVAASASGLPQFIAFVSKDWTARCDQIKTRDAKLADQIVEFKTAIVDRHAAVLDLLTSSPPQLTFDVKSYSSPHGALSALAKQLLQEADNLAKSDEAAERAKLELERNELIDRKALNTNKPRLVQRRDALKDDALWVLALAEVNTKGITQKANELVDTHLTKEVLDRYQVERNGLEISHLKVGLARKSDPTKATFQTTPGTTLTKLSSDILSEGEQRALALASFFTEIGVTEGAAPIIIDDPVSSLDRDRGLKVAARIATEAQTRQVIVFTHDLIFFNDLCREADERSVPTTVVALFADGANAGKIDPAGVRWSGLNVAKRLGPIKSEFSQVKKIHAASPADYEFKIKSLYGRLRDCYERVVEEFIFCDVIRRGVDRIETQKLRMVHLSDALAIRFHDGMTKANTYSHDNPAAGTVAVPTLTEFEADITFIETLISDLRAESSAVEAKRPTMKPKKS